MNNRTLRLAEEAFFPLGHNPDDIQAIEEYSEFTQIETLYPLPNGHFFVTESSDLNDKILQFFKESDEDLIK